MMIECYYNDCPHHEAHVIDDNGPFCNQDDCTATEAERAKYEARRVEALNQWQHIRQYPTAP